jgi:hypothetical protein
MKVTYFVSWRIKEKPGLWSRYRIEAVHQLRMLWAAPRSLHQAPPSAAAVPAGWLEQRQVRRARFALHGVWRHANLTALRPAIAAALDVGQDVQFDLAAIADADVAVPALMAIIERLKVQPRTLVAGAELPATLLSQLACCGRTLLFTGREACRIEPIYYRQIASHSA